MKSSVRNSYEFVKFVNGAHHRESDVMVSFDVVSLFTNVPVHVAKEVAADLLQTNQNLNERTNLTVSDIISLLDFCLSSSVFCFRSEIYRHKFGCPMGSPISMFVANLVMENIEKQIYNWNSLSLTFFIGKDL